MMRYAMIPVVALLAGCEGFEIPDFRGMGGGGEVVETSAPVIPLTAKERVVASLEGRGCVLDATTINAVMLDANVSQDDLVQIVPQLQAEGRAAVAGEGTIRLISDACT